MRSNIRANTAMVNDVAVVGSDDLGVAERATPALATVRRRSA